MLRALLAHRVPPWARRRSLRSDEQIELRLHLVQRQRADCSRRLIDSRSPRKKGRFDVAGDLGLNAAPAHEEDVAADGAGTLARFIRLDRDRVRAAIRAPVSYTHLRAHE